MVKSKGRGLGQLARMVETDRRFVADRAAVELVMHIAASLRKMREARNLSQTKLASMLDVTQGRISQIESGLLDHAPNVEMIARYAAACGMAADIRFSEVRVEEPAAA